ncbi:MAG: amidohydrolase family protein [Actinobacteria bacterium]|nr:amidohydrolase family protein [Actinomycetota bacterium]
MFDLLIRGGMVVDGTGAAPRIADVAIRDGRIVEVATTIVGEATEEIDAAGKLVTPGFIDIHTHYDGQISWDTLLEPSSGHGVTTVVVGNCGVGFAPVRPGQEEWLVQLMEGVEDIPGTALHEGISWDWETFPEYLDAIDKRQYSMDIAAYVPHGAVRGYVMGERGARNEDATATDIEEMARIVREAREAGAVGFSTSRTMGHKAKDGQPVPGTFASSEELNAIADALTAGGGGLFEIAPEVLPDGGDQPTMGMREELQWMGDLATRTNLKVTYLLLQYMTTPDAWREALDFSSDIMKKGGYLRPQVAARPFGMMVGWAGYHFFTKRPTYMKLAETLSLADLKKELAKPEVRAQILSETDAPIDHEVQFDGLGPRLGMIPHLVYAMGDNVDYEPTHEMSVAALAAAAGVSPLEMAYDLLNENNGDAFLMFPTLNYVEENHDVIYEMLTHPAAINGLSDGGAHVRMICDASIPTYLLTHWARDRARGPKLAIEEAVRLQTTATAEVLGMTDRGSITPGTRADINVIDFDKLTIRAPYAVNDLPAGGRRLLQSASGYVATIVNGTITRRDGVDTGARPGRLVRA